MKTLLQRPERKPFIEALHQGCFSAAFPFTRGQSRSAKLKLSLHQGCFSAAFPFTRDQSRSAKLKLSLHQGCFSAAFPFTRDQSRSATLKLSLVSRRCKSIRYFGPTFQESFVIFTPGETENTSWEIWPTQCSFWKHQQALGFKCFEFSTRCWKVWNFITLWNKRFPSSRAHSLSIL